MVSSIFIFLTRFSDAPCTPKSSFFGLPTWYKYLQSEQVGTVPRCTPIIDIFNNPEQIGAIALALVELLLMVGGLAAVAFVIYGGFRYLTSQGEPENTRAARQTIINALIGLFIVILATTIVRFIGSKLGGA